MTLALGATSGTAAAAAHRVPVAHALQLQRAAIDFAPVHDPSLVVGGGMGAAHVQQDREFEIAGNLQLFDKKTLLPRRVEPA